MDETFEGRQHRWTSPRTDHVIYESNYHVGIDVGKYALHCVSVTAFPGEIAEVVDCDVFAVDEIDSVRNFAAKSVYTCIDSPDRWSTAPYADDDTLPPSFRTARGCEVKLRELGVVVPFTTPEEPPDEPDWMTVGIEVFNALRADGVPCLETYPNGCYKWITGHKCPGAGSRPVDAYQCRADILATRVNLTAEQLAMWSLDALDAAMCAIVGLDTFGRTGTTARSTEDDTEIHLPRRQP